MAVIDRATATTLELHAQESVRELQGPRSLWPSTGATAVRGPYATDYSRQGWRWRRRGSRMIVLANVAVYAVYVNYRRRGPSGRPNRHRLAVQRTLDAGRRRIRDRASRRAAR